MLEMKTTPPWPIAVAVPVMKFWLTGLALGTAWIAAFTGCSSGGSSGGTGGCWAVNRPSELRQTYDPVTGRWSIGPSMPKKILQAVAARISREIYIFDTDGDVVRFDIQTEEYTLFEASPPLYL